ncbi:MAG TPA: hypothetical protein VJC17_00950 [Candidatus Dojkabacteria bacterium]|nr:hypothetical protein [Candidatus Dojkabacteria bacterium]
MEILYDTLKLLAGMLIILPASGLLIYSLIHITRYLRMRDYLVVFLVIGFATALPELFIGLQAASSNHPNIALGNALGSSIAAISLIAGVVAIFNKEFKTSKFFTSLDLTHLSISVILLSLLASDGYLSNIDGILLLISFTYYLLSIYTSPAQYKLPEIKVNKKYLLLYLFVAVISVLGIFFVSQSVVASTINLAKSTSLPTILIALTVLAPLGAVPELIFELEINKKSISKLTFGELFTSVLVNCTFIVGIIALIKPFAIEKNILFYSTALFLVLLLIAFNSFLRSRQMLHWKEGVILVIAYLVYLGSNFYIYISTL